MTRYQHLAELLAQRIEQGLYQSGERLPSVRALSAEHGVSISTVQQAYYLLEEKQLITPQPRSGYFVTPRKAAPPLPPITRPVQRPVEITQWDTVMELLNARLDNDVLQLGSGTPNIDPPTLKPLWKIISRLGQQQDPRLLNYDNLYGVAELREQIARLMIDSGCQLVADDVIITTGCHEALSVSIRAICQAGDIVAVESPAFHGTMQTLRGFGIRAIEIPTDSVSGISLEALELAFEQWPIKAVVVVPNCNNPLGFVMPTARKQALLSLAQRFDIAIIEDDVYGELAFDYPRPMTIKSLDTDGRVLLCSSFSKTLAPGLRVGWVVPGRYFDRVLHMKYISTGSTATQTQMAVAAFIRQGHYQPHLRRMRSFYQRNLETFTRRVRHHFPCGICVTRPQGGFLIWVELPEPFDAWQLNQDLRASGVQVAIGSLFSASGKYRNCLRLSYAQAFSEQIEKALEILGAAVERAMLSCLPAMEVKEEGRVSEKEHS
ncbi:GntR family transcriptional regulator [bacteria symbiont BFo1 of Frankliniella occidentalis]|jgi:DNA-binding transcriptional MocR family regulator|uniref:PLP-dependent aminotransferase family protein n=1 Tax=Erwinia aphidicola TaxID=68334 RepID=A0ABU8DLK6_ERWAP|nr:PLP-dependent aminotransferase family protein [Erwinia aphidicola]KMV72995.1 GntR family transcriptional regulator [bacteria symbiont BFo1 of Frankliniella occidentalis]KYP86842.1 GntR family transcriptional regulator [bacteria symbiont BFo1 of Frankliniella occidentalis]KYP92473.1 GntR family transcriptional regulator [bacteria symbiont BFo1 of Frankliniella occidentalis]MBD1378522.1 PLP-dependent aminotransferase family protein [Erwinia aphidicola]MCP2231497.1 DNA-binding transcriptional 